LAAATTVMEKENWEAGPADGRDVTSARRLAFSTRRTKSAIAAFAVSNESSAVRLFASRREGSRRIVFSVS
jgi:hypothetical protein